MEGMFNPLSILLHVINAAILCTALYFLLLKPVRKFMNKRTEKVEVQLNSVEAAKQGLDEQRHLAHSEIAAARKTATDTVAHGVAMAHEQAQKVLEDAHENAEHILKQARMEADFIRKSAREEMRGEVADLSISLASKLLKREVTVADHEQLVDDFLKKVV